MGISDYINSLMQDVMSRLAPQKMQETANSLLTLYIFQNENGQWISLCDDLREEGKIIESWINLNEIETRREKYIEFERRIFHYRIQKDVSDDRLMSDGSSKTLLWILHMKENKEALKLLAAIILDELIPKFKNMLIYEDMKTLCEKGIDGVKGRFFFGNLYEKKKLVDIYVERVYKTYNPPAFELLCHLSSMKYETRQNKTTLCFGNKEPKYEIQFDDSRIKFEKVDDLRMLRKVMEMAGEKGKVYILQPDMIITGIVQDELPQALAVEFKGDAEWILRKDEHEILIYRRGEYLIPVFEPTLEQELNKLDELADIGLSSERLENIKEIIGSLRDNSPHGTSIVFMENEALMREIEDRFSKYRYTIKVKEFDLNTSEMLRGIAAIDGAILSDLTGKCQAVGTILDGGIVEEGNPGRGARYNSVRNYIQCYKNEHPNITCFAVIFSEDGMLNVEIPT